MIWILSENEPSFAHRLLETLRDEGEDARAITESLSLEKLRHYGAQLKKEDLVIVYAEDAILPYLVACKTPGIVACLCADEHTAHMTREHNNARVLILDQSVSAPEFAYVMARRFLVTPYAGGRHQMRVDMLERMDGLL